MKMITDITEETHKSRSELGREYILDGLARQKEVEPSDTMERILENREVYRDTQEELLYYRLENERVGASVKRQTFLSFVDKTLAQLYLKLQHYYTDAELKKRLNEHLETFKDRAQYHEGDMMERIEARQENPVMYAQKKLDRMRKERAFEIE